MSSDIAPGAFAFHSFYHSVTLVTMILISGVNGFVGHHLAEICAGSALDVCGIGFGQLDSTSKLSSLLSKYLSIDLTKADQVNEQMDFGEVDSVIHLAGLAAVGPSFDQPARYVADNTAMLINLAEKALVQKSKARFVVVSSGAIYDPHQELPINEDGKLLANSPYAVSKIATELLCDYYRSRGLDVVVVRPFNHIGPGQGPGFILPDLANQAKDYAQSKKFHVGNLQTKRDFTDVRDVVRAYLSLIQSEALNHTVYNVCSGQSHPGEEILAEICKNMNIENPDIEIDQSKIRPNDIMDIRGDNKRIKADTGWVPEISLEQSIQDFISNSQA